MKEKATDKDVKDMIHTKHLAQSPPSTWQILSAAEIIAAVTILIIVT